MAFELPQRRQAVRQIQTQQRKIPLEQIIAIQGQSPLATGIETAGDVLGAAIQKRAELQRQGQQLAIQQQMEENKYARELQGQKELLALKNNTQEGGGRGGSTGYFVPRGVNVENGRSVFSNSKMPGYYYDDMTRAPDTALGKAVLQTLPSEQIEQESKMDTLSLALEKVKESYSDDLVGPVASRVGKAKQYVEPLANEQAANFYSNMSDMRNQIVYLRSGKQINQEEYKRLLDSIPNETTSATDFKVRLANFEQLKDTILASRQKNFQGTGYRTANGLKSINSPKPSMIKQPDVDSYSRKHGISYEEALAIKMQRTGQR